MSQVQKRPLLIVAIILIFVSVVAMTAAAVWYVQWNNQRVTSLQQQVADQQQQIVNSENAAKSKATGLSICLENAKKNYDAQMKTSQVGETIMEDGSPTTYHDLDDWQRINGQLDADRAKCNEDYK